MTKDELEALLDDLFTYHAPTPAQREHYDGTNEAARTFAFVVLLNYPDTPDRNEAVRLIRMAMTANSAIATKSGGRL